MNKISVYILTFNSEDRITDAIQSTLWADEVLVIDSHSTDKTVEIATQLGAHVILVDFKGFGNLRNQAISHCTHEWILSIDSDERCTEYAQKEILTIINDPQASDIYFIPRQNYVMGKKIRFSGWYPNFRQPQLFKKGYLSHPEEDLVHEGYIANGTIAYLENPIDQIPFKNISDFLDKAQRYSTLGAQKLHDKGKRGGMFKALYHGLHSFIRHYFFKLGILDGWPGFMIAFGNFEGTFYRYAKLTELQKKCK